MHVCQCVPACGKLLSFVQTLSIHCTYSVCQIFACVCFQMEVQTAETSLMAVETELLQATDSDDRTTTNLDTVDITFQRVAVDDGVSVNREAIETATRIVSEIQEWGRDEGTRETLQSLSAELVEGAPQ